MNLNKLPKKHPLRLASGQQLYAFRRWMKVMVDELDLQFTANDKEIQRFAILYGYPDLQSMTHDRLLRQYGANDLNGCTVFLHCDGMRSYVVSCYVGFNQAADNGYCMTSISTPKAIQFADRHNMKPEEVAGACLMAILLGHGVNPKEAFKTHELVNFVHARN